MYSADAQSDFWQFLRIAHFCVEKASRCGLNHAMSYAHDSTPFYMSVRMSRCDVVEITTFSFNATISRFVG